MVYWFTGQPGAGKTTLACNLKIYLEKISDKKVFHIDGDDLRNLFKNVNYNKEGRVQNVLRAQDITKYLHSQGYSVIVSLVSPYRDLRESFKKDLGPDMVEVYVHTKEVRGREHFHTDEYEPPLENYIDIDTTKSNIEDSLKMIILNETRN